MKIAIIGYGKMGKMIEQIALSQGHEIAIIVDPAFAGKMSESNKQIYPSIQEGDFDSTDVAIEFSRPDTAAANITALAQRKIPTVTGTTNWQEKFDDVKKAVETADSALLWASNFSIGVNLFYRISWYASELINNFNEYDIGGFEVHHNKKLDSPSGTAKTLAEGVISRIDRKKKIAWETLDRKPEDDELHYPSLRMGSVTGTHSLFFDSPADTIEITHTARNREGFASGAVQAAKWLILEKRHGVFTIDEMLKDILNLTT
jgi:4-hydroxy-tetrahydrodipicolinate reductase